MVLAHRLLWRTQMLVKTKGLLKAMKGVFGVFLVAIVMGLAAIATIPAATVTIDDVSLKFLPPETEGIVYIDVAELRSAPLVQNALKSNSPVFQRELDEFMKSTGIDPRQDIDRVTIAKLGARDSLVIVQGRMNRFKIEQFLRDKGGRPQGYLGQTLFRDGNGATVLLDNVAVMGQDSAVKKAVSQMQAPGSLPLRNDLTAAMQTIEAGNQIWGVGDVSIQDIGAGVRTPGLEMLKPLRSGTYQMRVDTGIYARAIGNFADADTARNIADLARGALAVAKLQAAKQQPELAPLLNGLEVSNSGTTMTVRIEASGEQLNRLGALRE
jgi:hypothetical protein